MNIVTLDWKKIVAALVVVAVLVGFSAGFGLASGGSNTRATVILESPLTGRMFEVYKDSQGKLALREYNAEANAVARGVWGILLASMHEDHMMKTILREFARQAQTLNAPMDGGK